MAAILVVDDEFGIAEVLDALLTDAGHRVIRAINGRQGLVRLHEQAFDLVLLDVMMPLMDGPEMLRTMRSDARYRDIPVILMSGLTRPSVDLRVEDAYQAYLQKPFRAFEVLDAIDEVLAAGRGSGGSAA